MAGGWQGPPLKAYEDRIVDLALGPAPQFQLFAPAGREAGQHFLDHFDGSAVSRLTVERCLRLDVRKLWRRGYRPGMSDTVCFDREHVVRIEVRETSIHLVHSFGGDSVRYCVPITRTRCYFGGSRPWFLCPGSQCGRRCAVLYRAGRYFLCRRCGGLAYQTQQEREAGRMALKAGRIWRRLGCGFGGEGLERPRGQHLRTFYRRLAAAKQGNDCFRASLEPLEAWLTRHRERAGK